MEPRFYIFKDGRSLGPMTATEIREGLRDGSFDPFDQVSREGSSVRVDLVEVDEIFVSNRSVINSQLVKLREESFSSDNSQNHALIPDTSLPSFQPLSASETEQPEQAPKIHLELADASVSSEAQIKAREYKPVESKPQKLRQRREPKSYHIMDRRGRVLGPLSAHDISSLYYKGMIDSAAVVMKNGTKVQVGIEKFVAVYAQNRLGGQHPDNGNARLRSPQFGVVPIENLDTRKALAAASLERERLTYLAYSLSGLLLVLALCLLLFSPDAHVQAKLRTLFEKFSQFDHGKVLKSNPQPSRKEIKSQSRPKRSHQKSTGSQSDTSLTQNRSRKTVTTLASQQQQPRDQLKSVITTREFLEQRKREQRRAQLAQKRQDELARRHLEQRLRRDERWRQREQREAIPRRMAANSARPTVEMARPQSSRPQTKRRLAATQEEAAFSPAVDTLVDGQQISGFGPVQFQRDEIERCQAACTITFRGPRGSLRGKFFKSVWGPILLNKSGSVYLTGMVRKSSGSTTIILSNVQ